MDEWPFYYDNRHEEEEERDDWYEGITDLYEWPFYYSDQYEEVEALLNKCGPIIKKLFDFNTPYDEVCVVKEEAEQIENDSRKYCLGALEGFEETAKALFKSYHDEWDQYLK